MNKAPLLVPALSFALGAYVLLASLNAGETAEIFGGLLAFRAKFGILLGGVGIFAGVAIAVEMLTRKRPALQSAPRR